MVRNISFFYIVHILYDAFSEPAYGPIEGECVQMQQIPEEKESILMV